MEEDKGKKNARRSICFLTDSIFSVGGVQRVLSVVAIELAKSNDVTIVTFDSPSRQDTSLYGLDKAPIRYRYFAYPRVNPLWRRMLKTYSAVYRKLRLPWPWASDIYAHTSFPKTMQQALVSELKQGGYNVIVAVHAPLAVRLATVAPQLKGVATIGWIHNSFEALFGKDSTYIGEELKRHYVRQLNKLDQFVVLCHHDADKYKNFDKTSNPAVIYNPLTLMPGSRSKGTSKTFLAVGRLTRLHKGFDLLVEAFSIFAAKDENRDWKLKIVGEGPEENTLRKQIEHCHLEQRIELLPFTRNIQNYYSESQIFVLSSRWEGFGLVLTEAMAHGVPVVSSNLPTSLELMGDFALYFENGNAADLARQLQASTTINWKEKSDQAVTIASTFAADAIISQWQHVIDHVLENAP